MQVQLLDHLRALGSSTPPKSIARTTMGKTALRTRTWLREQREWETLTIDGCVLSLASQYELAARDMAETTVTRMASRFKKYGALPEKVRKNNVRFVGEYLTEIDDTRRAHINYLTVVSNLARCTTKGKPISLFVEGFSMHQRNLRPGELTSLFARMEVKELWPKIGHNPWIRGHLGTTGDATNAAREKLNAFIEDRNSIAHRGPGYQTLSATDVVSYINYFRALLWALADVLDAHVSSY
jgi:RiboL-PSP-HEPN